jgi:hypothetical protein
MMLQQNENIVVHLRKTLLIPPKCFPSSIVSGNRRLSVSGRNRHRMAAVKATVPNIIYGVK